MTVGYDQMAINVGTLLATGKIDAEKFSPVV